MWVGGKGRGLGRRGEWDKKGRGPRIAGRQMGGGLVSGTNASRRRVRRTSGVPCAPLLFLSLSRRRDDPLSSRAPLRISTFPTSQRAGVVGPNVSSDHNGTATGDPSPATPLHFVKRPGYSPTTTHPATLRGQTLHAAFSKRSSVFPRSSCQGSAAGRKSCHLSLV